MIINSEVVLVDELRSRLENLLALHSNDNFEHDTYDDIFPEISTTQCDHYHQHNEEERKQSCFEITCAKKMVTDSELHTQYTIDVQEQELPVIGTFVDNRIVPGFFYRVRRIGSNDFLFNGQARCLISVGMGYGKRITFKGDAITDNSDFYFYSDTEQEGFAFIPAIPEECTSFSLCKFDGKEIATVKITGIDHSQTEVTCVQENRNIQKTINVSLTCDILFTIDLHGVVSMHSELLGYSLQGLAQVRRKGSAKSVATLECITGICIPDIGVCTLTKKQ